ncbi:hypothetical protein U8527_12170 [Kordia algicida OT-1]|uniref:Secreted protein n=1 Tax=Kordia algicida OT-1 TaxID=391587 RepID=A9E0J9_9FLAO|nr:hypothetical protein [Kordia algicida]EDP95877.1 hypothetical protein KAOT1_05717 [Kordia algicida OT-1]
MKNISFILGILILALALKPCADGFCSDDETETEICSENHQEHGKNHENDSDDSCAMLCVCNCCGTLVVHQEPPIFILQSKNSISTKINTHYESHYRFDMLFAIWQPPQVVS